MDTPLLISLVASATAVASAVWSARSAEKLVGIKAVLDRQAKASERQAHIAQYQEPLTRAAYDLQSRIYNILRQGLLGYLENGNDRERRYVSENTLFLICQLFCWIEIARLEIRFIDLGTDEATARLSKLLDNLQGLWGIDNLPSPLRIFAGEQRAIGEALICGSEARPACLGYGGFIENFPPGRNILVDAVREDLTALPKTLPEATPRLLALQRLLIELIDMLDPQCLRYPADRRKTV